MPVAKKFILSDESINSYGFRVLTDGIDLSRFEKNPVMLMNHCEDDIPGAWGSVAKEGGKLVGVTRFDEKDEEALVIANKVEQGFINGASIGFCIIETSTDPALMLPGQTRPTVTKCILYEASITPLPSNGNALALYDNNGQKLKLDDEALNFNKLSLIQNSTQPDMKLTAKTQTVLNVSADAADTAIETAVLALEKRATDAETSLKTIKDTQTAELKTRSEKLVDNAITGKKLTADKRDAWVNLAIADYASTETALNSMKGAANINTNLKDGEGETGGEDRTKWTLTDWRQKDSKGLQELKLNDEPRYNKLVEENK
jgi:hypothetical protein